MWRGRGWVNSDHNTLSSIHCWWQIPPAPETISEPEAGVTRAETFSTRVRGRLVCDVGGSQTRDILNSDKIIRWSTERAYWVILSIAGKNKQLYWTKEWKSCSCGSKKLLTAHEEWVWCAVLGRCSFHGPHNCRLCAFARERGVRAEGRECGSNDTSLVPSLFILQSVRGLQMFSLMRNWELRMIIIFETLENPFSCFLDVLHGSFRLCPASNTVR